MLRLCRLATTGKLRGAHRQQVATLGHNVSQFSGLPLGDRTNDTTSSRVKNSMIQQVAKEI